MTEDSRPVRVAVDARLVHGEYGGVEQVVIGLAHGLSGLDDSADEYHFLTYEGDQPWLEPYIRGNCRIVPSLPSPAPKPWKRVAKSVAPFTAPLWRRLRYGTEKPPLGPRPSDGAAERLQADVVHFPQQQGFRTEIPSVYHPHDLQHLHLPDFFTAEQTEMREAMYRAMCEQAEMVTVTSRWGKDDVVQHYGLPEDKVIVIQLAPALSAFDVPSDEELAAIARRLELPERFIFYAAQTWPHKNHLRLLDALALLRDRDNLVVPLVCSGRLNEHYDVIRARVSELRLDHAVRFLGFVGSDELQALNRLSTAVVIPTLFEAFGGFGPLSEAFLAGTPVAVSNVTSLAEQAGDSALIMDPTDVESIADAVKRLWTDEELRARLVEGGRRNVARFTWDRTARTFRAHYRRIAGRTLSDDDQALIDAPPAF